MSDIATLFATDPEKLSDADIDKIIEYDRKNRAAFKAGVSVKQPKVSEAAGKVAEKLDLGSLGL